jgi:hypothetical protein
MADTPAPTAIDIAGPPPPPIARRTTIPERRESARKTLALILVGIFGIEVIGALAALVFFGVNLQDLKDIIPLILGPTVALVGSVVGFYFGTQEAGGQSALRENQPTAT